MHSFRRFFNISTFLASGLMILSCLYAKVSALDFDRVQYDLDRTQFTKTFISEYYKDMEKRMKVVNVEEEFKEVIGDITPENAAEVLGFAIVMHGDAPKADEIFRRYYDPFNPYIYPNLYREHHVFLEPETEEAADALAELNVGIATQWPILVQIKRKSHHKVRQKYKITAESNLDFFQKSAIVNDGMSEIKNEAQAVLEKRKFTEHRIPLSLNITKYSTKTKKRKH